MIDGEIYALDGSPKCVFAYCERGGYKTSHYIGVLTSGDVSVSTTGCIYGMSSNSPCHLADEEEMERFRSILADEGYVWNQANKVVTKNNGTIIKI